MFKRYYIIILFFLFGCSSNVVQQTIVEEDLLIRIPVDLQKVKNFNELNSKLKLNPNALDFLSKNGFVIINGSSSDTDFSEVYNKLRQNGFPVIITSDSIVHTFHIILDQSLKEMEEQYFYDELWNLSNNLYKNIQTVYNTSKGATRAGAQLALGYVAVALDLLSPDPDQFCKNKECLSDEEKSLFSADKIKSYVFKIPPFFKKNVSKEISLIKAANGTDISPLFNYNEDYSQYIPSGYYNGSEKLKNLFKALTWYGRAGFLLSEKNIKIANSIKLQEASIIQTIGSIILSNEILKNEDLKVVWDKIYNISSFYNGYGDGLTPYNYMDAVKKISSSELSYTNLNNTDYINKIKIILFRENRSRIFNGQGECKVDETIPPQQGWQQLNGNGCIMDNAGLRFFGRRYKPDSELFQNLIIPFVKERVFPSGLDLFSILSSPRAQFYLDKKGISKLSGYLDSSKKIAKEWSGFSEWDWHKNIYYSWLYALKSLVEPKDKTYPYIMKTEAWQDKELTTALALWTQLKHDTIFYPEQSNAMQTTGMESQKNSSVKGYIEPQLRFYDELLFLSRQVRNKLNKSGMVDLKSINNLTRFIEFVDKVTNISKKELNNVVLDVEDYNFIDRTDINLKRILDNIEGKSCKTTIAVELHTNQDDINPGILIEGVGKIKLLIMVYYNELGEMQLGLGPVLTHYEFINNISDHIDDEKWEEMLNKNIPQLPEWESIYNF